MSRTNCAIGKDYAPASFKGVFFYALEADIEGGRRGAEGEFPFSERTAYADLGRKIRVYHVTAAFREDDHVSDSQALFNACESPGPGILVHPTRGAVMVACRSIKVKDEVEEKQGETHAEMEFVEANTQGLGDLGGSIFGIISSALYAVSQASFLGNYQPLVAPQPWSTDVIDTAQRIVAATAVPAEHTLTTFSPTPQWRAVLRMYEVASDDGLAAFPEIVNSTLNEGFRIIVGNIQNPDVKFDIFRKLANVAVPSKVMPKGPAHDSEQAVLSRQRVLAGISMADAAMARRYPTVDDSLAAKDTVLAVLNDEAKIAYDTCDNALYMELVKYATEFSAMMDDLSYRLPIRVLIDFSGGVHGLVAAYTIYKDAKRHRELELSNIMDANGRMGPIVAGSV